MPAPQTLPATRPDTGTAPGAEHSEKEGFTPLYNVVLLDDDDHTYEYVIEMLCRTFFISPSRALQHAIEVDTTGRTIVLTCERDAAEFGRDQIHAYGADPRMARSKGSMTAIIEPAGG